MSVQVKYFASLRERIGRSHDEVAFAHPMTVQDIWNTATQNTPIPEQLLAAVNQEYTQFDKQVADGDEVAFFPPVTGG